MNNRVAPGILALFLVQAMMLSACASSQSELAREASDYCVSPNDMCSPEMADAASLDTLRTNSVLRVECEVVPVLDDAYRQRCAARISKLADSLSRRWRSQMAPVLESHVRLTDREICRDTFIPGQEEADCRWYYISADLPLEWIGSP